jgi:hypothetical protein
MCLVTFNKKIFSQISVEITLLKILKITANGEQYDKYPEIEEMLKEKVEVELKEGESLYIPPFVWYSRRSVTEGMVPNLVKIGADSRALRFQTHF